MRSLLLAFTLCLSLAFAACSKKATPPLTETKPEKSASPTPVSTPANEIANTKHLDACALLTGPEIEGIQGAAPVDTKPSVNSHGGLTVSQCYFLLPVAVNSIVVTVTQKSDGSGGSDPKEAWGKIFHEEHENAEREEEKEKGKEPLKPQNIPGLGDEAYWTPQRFGGVLYALKGNSYISVSVGGAGDQASKLQKSKSLAELILKRL
ncbi:MAG: hypothetical protein QOH88_3568 [Verrucomicrobiota bacterium]|jgi:hypothetical protein